jgi:anti-sigma B factor antagonist
MLRPVEVSESSMQPSLEVSHRDVGDGVCIVSPGGEIDLACAPRLKVSLVGLLDEGFTRFIVDLSAVRYLDSTGLGVLIAFSRRLADDGQIMLARVPEFVVRVLELTGLEAQFPTFATVDDALAQVRGAAQPVQPPLSPDAEMVVGLAATALPFAESSADELRRWVRILSAYGEAGRALRHVGLTDTAIAQPAATAAHGKAHGLGAHAESVTRVTAVAAAIAADREAVTVSTVDLLLAVMAVYGDAFDQELHAHGTSPIELIDCLGSGPDSAPAG